MELLIPISEAKEKLLKRITRGNELVSISISNEIEFESVRDEFYRWDAFNKELLSGIFTTDRHLKNYEGWLNDDFALTSLSLRSVSISQKIKTLHNKMYQKLHSLDLIVEKLDIALIQQKQNDLNVPLNTKSSTDKATNKVFVVHGHNESAKNNLDIFLRENGLEPIVLHRQADEGLTIIEKFEKHSEVGYAFILLTPDEIAYLKAEDSKPDDERKKEYRARPNVIFEFGYFIGKLGRSRVCCLHTGNVSLPSDVNGMIYKSFNNNNIEEAAYSILKDLRAAGYKV